MPMVFHGVICDLNLRMYVHMKNDEDTNYKERKYMLKLFNKYSKAPLVNVLNKESLHQGSATYSSYVATHIN